MYLLKFLLQIVLLISTPIYLMFVASRAFIFPLKDWIGELACHLISFIEIYSNMMAQSHTFFISMFRYVCIIHNQTLLKRNVKGRVSKKYLQFSCNLHLSKTFFFFFRVLKFSRNRKVIFLHKLPLHIILV